MSASSKHQKQTPVTYGDIIYIQYVPRTLHKCLLLYANGFNDNLVYAGSMDTPINAAFKSTHFLILPSIQCNSQGQHFLSFLVEQLNLLNDNHNSKRTFREQVDKDASPPSSRNDTSNLLAKHPESGLRVSSEENERIAAFKTERLTENNSGDSSPLSPKFQNAGYQYFSKELQKKNEIEISRNERMISLNFRTLQEHLGKPVKYEDRVLLYHFESQQFLCTSNCTNPIDSALLKLSLKKIISTGCYFQFQTLPKFGNTGEIVNYELPLTIVSYDGYPIDIGSQDISKLQGDATGISTKHAFDLNQVPEDPRVNDEYFPYDIYRSSFCHKAFTETYAAGIKRIRKTLHHFKISLYSTHQNRVETQKLKGINNGDYVRIEANHYTLTATKTPYEQRGYFERSDLEDSQSSLIHSVFQIIHLDKEWMNMSKLPLGKSVSFLPWDRAFEKSGEKGFLLKHFFTNLVFDNPSKDKILRPFESSEENQNENPYTEIHLYGQTPEAEAAFSKSVLPFMKISSPGEQQDVFFDDGKRINSDTLKVQKETSYFTGFRDPGDSIQQTSKIHRKKPMNKPKLPSAMKFIKISDEEIYTMNQSIHFAKELKIFYLTIVSSLNSQTVISEQDLEYMTHACKKYYKYLFTNNAEDPFVSLFGQASKDHLQIDTVNKTKQIYARECRIIDLCNKILFYLAVNSGVSDEEFMSDIPTTTKVAYLKTLTGLIDIIVKIILANIRNNGVNHRYNCQYVKTYVWALLKPQGLYKHASTLPTDENRLKDIFLPLIVEFFWGKDLYALDQINHFKKECFNFLENQQDFSVHALQLLQFAFRGENPYFYPYIRDYLMEDFLCDSTRFKNLIPEMVQQSGAIYFVFRRRGKEPIELEISELTAKRKEAIYLMWILKLICAMDLRKSMRFSIQIANYFNLADCKCVMTDPKVFYEIRNLMSLMTSLIHFGYKELPWKSIPPQIKIFSSDEDTVLAVIHKMFAKERENLIRTHERDMLLSSGKFLLIMESENLEQGLQYLKTLDLTTYSFKEFTVALSIATYLLKGQTAKELETLVLLYNNMWAILETSLKEQRNQEVSNLIERAFSLLILLDVHIITFAVDYALENIRKHVLQKFTLELSEEAPADKKKIKSLAVVVQESIVKAFGQDTKKKIFEVIATASKNLTYGPETTDKLMLALLKNEKEQATLQIALRYMAETTRLNSLAMRTLYNYSLFDTPMEISGLTRLVELICEINSIKREIQFIREFHPSSVDQQYIHQLLGSLVLALEEVLTIVYDYHKHVRDFISDSDPQIKRAFFINGLREAKSKHRAQAFVLQPQAVGQLWQKALRSFNIEALLIPICIKLVNHHFMGDECYEDNNVRLSLRLIMIIMMIYVYKNSENQHKLATYEPFIYLFFNPEPEKDELFGVDRDIVFISLFEENQQLLRMDHKYILDILITRFINPHKNNADFISKNSDNPWELTQMQSLKTLVQAQIPEEYFDPYQIIASKFSALIDGFTNHDGFSFKTVVKKSTTPFNRNTKEFIIHQPMSYEILLEFFKGISSLLKLGNEQKVAVMQQEIPPESWYFLLVNKNFMFQFEARGLIYNGFIELFLQNFKKPGVFDNKDRTFAFLGILLLDIASYVDFKSLEQRTTTQHSLFPTSDNGSFVKKLRESAWLGPIIQKNEQLKIIFDEYADILAAHPLADYYTSVSLINKPFVDHWVNCIAEGCIRMLTLILAERHRLFADRITKPIEYIINLILELHDLEVENSRIQRELHDFAVNLVSRKEYSFYKQILANIAYKSSDSADIYDSRKRSVYVGNFKKRMSKDYTSVSMAQVINLQAEKLLKEEKFHEEQELVKFGTSLRDNREVASRLVLFIRRAIHDRSQLTSECQFAVKVLTEILKANNSDPISRQKPIYEWGQLDLSDQKGLTETQNYLNEIGLPQLTVRMIETNSDEKIVTELLNLLICLVYSGNPAVQDTLFKLVDNDPENSFAKALHKHFTNQFYALKAFEEGRVQRTYSICQNKMYFLHQANRWMNVEGLGNRKEKILQEVSESLPESDKVWVSSYASPLLLGLKLVQSLCENHCTNFQEYFREQKLEGKPHPHSVNFVKFCEYMIHDYIQIINRYNVEFGMVLLDTLVELVQCQTRRNASLLLKNTLLEDIINSLAIYDMEFDLISRGFNGEIMDETYMAYKKRAVIVLKELVEGADPIKLKYIQEQVNFAYLIRTLYNFLRHFFKEKGFVFSPKSTTNRKKLAAILNRAELSDHGSLMKTALRLYSVLKYLWSDLESKIDKKILKIANESEFTDDETNELSLYIYCFLEKYLLSIEVVTNREKDLIRIYFPMLTICSIIKKSDEIPKFLKSVDRSNAQTKVEGLLTQARKMDLMIKAYYEKKELFNYTLGFKYFLAVSHAFVLAINLFIIFAFHSSEDSAGGVTRSISSQETILMYMLFVQVFLATVQLIWNAKIDSKGVVSSKWTQRIDAMREELGLERINEVESSFKKDQNAPANDLCDLVLDLKGPSSEEYKILSKKRRYIQIQKFFIETRFIFTSWSFLWNLFFLCICIASLFEWFICTLQTFNWVVRSDTVKRVGMAISANRRSFAWTFLLLVIVLYIYSMVGYYFMNEYFQNQNGAFCTDTFTCFFQTINFGLRSGGGIADALEGEYDANDSRWILVLKVLYDLSFFFLVIILLLNVIFGMIIDSFGDLRDQKNAYDEDRKNICFICGIERGEYERKANFDIHVKQEHNPENYIYYLVYLLEKERTSAINLTDIESYVATSYHAKENRWIPIGRSLTLEERS